MAALPSYYDDNSSFTSYYHQHHYHPTQPAITGYQDVTLSGYVQPGYGLMNYQYWVPMHYRQYHPQYFVPSANSRIMNPREEQRNYRSLFIQPFDESWIMNDQSWIMNDQEEEEEHEPYLTEEELQHLTLIDEQVVVYDTTRDDDGLSEETITKHLNTRNHHAVNADDICAVCQDCLFQEEEKIATLDCGHDFHAECIKTWLMLKNRCPLCNATGIRL